MPLVDRLKTPPAAATGIACLKFEATPGTTRCAHYAEGGMCQLPDEFRCIEWLRRKGQEDVALQLVEMQRKQLAAAASAQPTDEARPQRLERLAILHRLTPEDVASFERLELEVEFGMPGEESVWLVPAYTPERGARAELSIHDAAVITAIVAAFPGAAVVGMRRLPSAVSAVGQP